MRESGRQAAEGRPAASHPGGVDASGAESVARAAAQAARRGPPPVHLWNPPFCGDLDMRIAADGSWWYLGTPIVRPALVRLFASVLRRDGDRFYLVTPVEKVGITVDDAPFVVVDIRAEGDRLIFTTNVGDEAVAGPENTIRFAETPRGPRPYIHVRRGLEALIDRKTYYRMVEAAETRIIDGVERIGVASSGAFFPIAGAE
jgi:hypothetical protein